MGDKIVIYQWVVVVLSVVTCDLRSARELLPVSGLDRSFQWRGVVQEASTLLPEVIWPSKNLLPLL